MNSRVNIDHSFCAAHEKIGARCIRVRDGRMRSTAVIGSFFAADKLLLAWSICQHGVLACEFVITYVDGHTLSGVYEFRRKGASRPALMQHVRAAAEALCSREGQGCTSAVHGFANRPAAFLERYETEDFAAAAA